MVGLLLFGAQWPGTGYSNGADAQVACQLVVIQGKERAIGGKDCWNLREALLMMCQACQQFRCVGWIARQHRVAGDQSAIDFIEHDLATELGREMRFASGRCC
jgi:hypothetical protein